MRKFLVQIQYNGKNYGGWQRNDNAKTIQGEVESALEKLFGESIETTGASRTDGGRKRVFVSILLLRQHETACW